jgi:hypothetical protein
MSRIAILLIHGVSGDDKEGRFLTSFCARFREQVHVLQCHCAQNSLPTQLSRSEHICTAKHHIDFFEPQWLACVRDKSAIKSVVWCLFQLLRPPFAFANGVVPPGQTVDKALIFYASLAVLFAYAWAFCIFVQGVTRFFSYSIFTLPLHLAHVLQIAHCYLDCFKIGAITIVIPLLYLSFRFLAQAALNSVNSAASKKRTAARACLIRTLIISSYLILVFGVYELGTVFDDLGLPCYYALIYLVGLFLFLVIAVNCYAPAKNIIGQLRGYVTNAASARTRILADVEVDICSVIAADRYDEIVLVGHSLGAEILVDALTNIAARRTSGSFTIITMGGAISLMGAFFPRSGFPFHDKLPNIPLAANLTTWLNFWMTYEILGLPLPVAPNKVITNFKLPDERSRIWLALKPLPQMMLTVNLHDYIKNKDLWTHLAAEQVEPFF